MRRMIATRIRCFTVAPRVVVAAAGTPDDRTDPHHAASIDVLFGPSDWPVAIDAYLLASRDEYRRIVLTTGSPGFFPAEVWYVMVETGIGVRKT